MEQSQPSPDVSSTPRALSMLLVFLGFFAVEGLTVYRDAFHIKPAGDDFELIGEIRRGNTEGPLKLYTTSLSDRFYRPSKSFVIWLSGRGAEEGRACRIRLAHFVLTVPYIVALCLWLRLLRVQWIGAIVAGVAMLLHPGLVATLSSIDGCGGMMASGLMWLAAWFVATGEKRPWLSTLIVVACFVFGLTWKEYIFALVPLAALAAVMFRNAARWRAAIQIALILFAIFLVYLPIRHATIPGNELTGELIARNPIKWVTNLAIAASGLTFFGNTVWLMLNHSMRTYAIAGAAMLATVVWMLIGLVAAMRDSHLEARVASSEVQPRFPFAGLRAWILFALLGLGAATCPGLFHANHFAEKYLCPLLLPFALLCAIAIEGWARTRWRYLGHAAVIVAVISGAAAVRQKNAEMRRSGELAERQCLQILDILGPSADRPQKILLVYLLPELASQPRYSVYRFADDGLLIPQNLFDWWRPNHRIATDWTKVDSLSEVDVSGYDAAVLWDVSKQSFVPLKMPGR